MQAREIKCEQGSQDWIQARMGVITGTRFEQAYKQSSALMNVLISEKMASFKMPSGSSLDMRRGNELEPFAKKAYEQQTGRTVNEYGLLIHSDRDDIGLSPDGVCSSGKRAIEIKSPRSETHVQYMRTNEIPTKYIFQLSAYFLVIPEIESIDFVSFDEFNEVQPLHIRNITLDELMQTPYQRGKTIGSIDELKSKVFEFADRVNAEYEKLVF